MTTCKNLLYRRRHEYGKKNKQFTMANALHDNADIHGPPLSQNDKYLDVQGSMPAGYIARIFKHWNIRGMADHGADLWISQSLICYYIIMPDSWLTGHTCNRNVGRVLISFGTISI